MMTNKSPSTRIYKKLNVVPFEAILHFCEENGIPWGQAHDVLWRPYQSGGITPGIITRETMDPEVYADTVDATVRNIMTAFMDAYGLTEIYLVLEDDFYMSDDTGEVV